MNLNFRIKIYVAVAIFLAITYFFKNTNQEDSLPVIGGIPDFEFIDSEGRDVGLSTLKGKVWVADFIFTTCTMACPIMTGNMNIIHKKYKKNDDIRLVSISVYPEYDTPEVLKKYASQYEANTDTWHFLTGNENTVKEVIKDGFKIPSNFNYNDLASKYDVPANLVALINNKQNAFVALKIVEIIGEDEPYQLDSETIYFITNLLNEMSLTKIRNKVLISALPQRV